MPQSQSLPYDVFAVANALLILAKNDQTTIDPLKLQKLVYLSHGWNLAFTDHPLIQEAVEAWEYGPVVPKLYKEFREFKASPITRMARREALPILEAQSDGLVSSVWQIYKPFSAIRLSMLTHEPGSAWDIVRRASEAWESPVIPNELIREEFLRKKITT